MRKVLKKWVNETVTAEAFHTHPSLQISSPSFLIGHQQINTDFIDMWDCSVVKVLSGSFLCNASDLPRCFIPSFIKASMIKNCLGNKSLMGTFSVSRHKNKYTCLRPCRLDIDNNQRNPPVVMEHKNSIKKGNPIHGWFLFNSKCSLKGYFISGFHNA